MSLSPEVLASSAQPGFVAGVAGQPDALRWAVDAGLPEPGWLTDAPAELGAALADGRLAKALVEVGGVILWPATPAVHNWGQQAQEWLAEALVDVSSWRVRADPAGVLRVLADDVLGGEMAAYIASHGGHVEVVNVSGLRVDVVLGGVCVGCPAAELTLQGRLQVALTRRFGRLVEVVDVSSPRRRLWAWPKRRVEPVSSSRP